MYVISYHIINHVRKHYDRWSYFETFKRSSIYSAWRNRNVIHNSVIVFFPFILVRFWYFILISNSQYDQINNLSKSIKCLFLKYVFFILVSTILRLFSALGSFNSTAFCVCSFFLLKWEFIWKLHVTLIIFWLG